MRKWISLLLMLLLICVSASALASVEITYFDNDIEHAVCAKDILMPDPAVHTVESIESCGFAAPEDGYAFDCWLWYMQDEESGKMALMEALQAGAKVYIGKKSQFVANWYKQENALECMLIFELNGGKAVVNDVELGWLETERAEEGRYVMLPPAHQMVPPTEEYAFAGWEIDGVVYPGNGYVQLKEESMTATAVWELAANMADCTVCFEADDGQGTRKEAKVKPGLYELPECSFTAPEGMQFKAWRWMNSEYAPGDSIRVVGYTNVYAVWEKKPFVITFDGNGATAGEMAGATVREGESYLLPWCDYEREGHNFEGWLVNGELKQPYDYVTVTADTKIVASWKAYVFNIHFSAGIGKDGNNSAGVSLEKDYGAGFALPTPEEFGFSCDYHEFTGWRDETNGPNENGKTYAAGDKFVPTAFTILVAQWKPMEFKVTFNAGEGTGTMAEGVATYGYPYNLPECGFTAPEGYEFKAWLLDGKETPVGTSLLATADTTVTALWQIKTYTVTYQTGDGMGAVRPVEDVPHGQKVKLAEPPDVDDKWVFAGWKIGDETHGPGYEITVTADVTAVAQWKVRDVQISYENDAGETLFVDDTLTYGDAHTVLTLEALNAKLDQDKHLTAPEGYLFKNWQVLNTRNEVIDTANTGDMMPVYSIWKLRANWVPEEPTLYTVSFDGNGAKGSIASELVQAGTQYTLPQPKAFDMEGYDFAGWKVGDSIVWPNNSIMVNSDVTAVAQWKQCAVSITYQEADGTPLAGHVYEMLYGEKHLVRTPEQVNLIEPNGKIFGGWAVHNSRGEKLSDVFAVSGEEMTVYSHWLIRPVWVDRDMLTVSFAPGEGGGTQNPAYVYQGYEYELPPCTFTAPVGKCFAGWQVGGENHQPGDKITISEPTSVLAIWETTTVKLTFKANNSSNGMLELDVLYGTEYPLPECTFTADGDMVFDKWRINGAGFEAGSTYTVTGDVEILADWAKSEYTVTLCADNGTDEQVTATVKFRDAFILPENSFEAPYGKMFSHWLLQTPAGDEPCDVGCVFSTVKADLTFKAVWVEKGKHAVTFDANGGEGELTEYVYDGYEYELPECGFIAPVGKEFMCWSVGGVEYAPGKKIPVNGQTTVKAIWTEATLLISFAPGDCGSGNMATEEAKYGLDYILPECGFSYASEDYIFLGWNLNGTYYAPGDAVKLYSDTTFTAMWAARWYTITMRDSNGSASPYLVKVEYGDSYTIKEAASYGFAPQDATYHEFDTWTRISDGKTFAPGYTIEGVKRSMTIEAMWKFRQVIEVEDEETGEVIEATVEAKGVPETVNPNNDALMNTSDTDKLPPQLGDMLAKLQENTAGANPEEGGVVIETMQDVVNELQVAINGEAAGVNPAPDAGEDEQPEQPQEPEYPVENIIVTDIKPVIEVTIEGKTETVEITSKTMLPDARGLRVSIPIPEGADPATHQYKIVHMLTQDAWDGSGLKAGDVEVLKVDGWDDQNLYVWMYNFSPVAIAWKEKPAGEIVPDPTIQGAIEALPKTGDASCLMGWIALLGASAAGLAGMKRRKK